MELSEPLIEKIVSFKKDFSMFIHLNQKIQWEGFTVQVHAKTKKVIEIPPFLHFGLKGPRSENLKKSYLWSEMSYLNFYFCFQYLKY